MDSLKTHLPKALEVFLTHRRSDDVLGAMIQAGIDAESALVFYYFIPIAFTRLALKSAGIHFAESFECRVGDRNLGPFSYGADPRYSFLLESIPPSVSEWTRDDILAIAGRSSEFKAINKLAHESTSLEGIRLTETLFLGASAEFLRACVPYNRGT